jgi:hypothetical protein
MIITLVSMKIKKFSQKFGPNRRNLAKIAWIWWKSPKILFLTSTPGRLKTKHRTCDCFIWAEENERCSLNEKYFLLHILQKH